MAVAPSSFLISLSHSNALSPPRIFSLSLSLYPSGIIDQHLGSLIGLHAAVGWAQMATIVRQVAWHRPRQSGGATESVHSSGSELWWGKAFSDHLHRHLWVLSGSSWLPRHDDTLCSWLKCSDHRQNFLCTNGKLC